MEESFTEVGAGTARYAARQPILAADETVIGYKLLFRAGVADHFAWKECEGASRSAIEISSLLGLNVLADSRLAFIPCTRELLLARQITFLSPEKVVAAIGREVLPDAAIEEACRSLKSAGYKLAFEHFSSGDPRESLIDLADFLIVDLRRTPWEDVLRVTGDYGNQSLSLLAENVETREDFE